MAKPTAYCVTLFFLCLMASPANAELTVAKIFGDHMVLQQQQEVPVWGTAEPKQKVTVRFANTQRIAIANEAGRWSLRLPALKASKEPAQFVVEADTIITFKDVLVGEVWVCSGQSNMEWSVNASKNAAEEKKAANYPAIRHVKVPRRPSDRPETDFNAGWSVCSPGTTGNFTAVGYYFARTLHKALDVPIGLINTSWGGTRIEPWIPLVGFKQIATASFAPKIIEQIESAVLWGERRELRIVIVGGRDARKCAALLRELSAPGLVS